MDPSRLQEIGLITGVFIKLDQGVPYYVGMLLVFASTWSFWNWVVSFKLVCPAAIELIYEPNMKRWMQVCWTLILPHVGPLGLLCPLVIGGLLLEVCTIWPYAVNFIRLQRRKVATAPDGSPGVSTPVVVVPDPGDAEAAPPPVVVQATVIGVADEDKEEHNETNESNNVISSGNDPEDGLQATEGLGDDMVDPLASPHVLLDRSQNWPFRCGDQVHHVERLPFVPWSLPQDCATTAQISCCNSTSLRHPA
ncbi:unnamed protein product [Durusdinium trenchii]|uniref:Uncharacterized protein n=1 Tax=Durusdinium trenchii TaxID=1381693 RepID=A0ABP0NZ18_9DINO